MAAKPVTRIQLRRDPAADWATSNPVLAGGEPGYESDTGRMKVGDGVKAWKDLPYAAPSDAELQKRIGHNAVLFDDSSKAGTWARPAAFTNDAPLLEVVDDAAATDGKALRVTGTAPIFHQHKIPYNPHTLYKVEVRLRADPDDGGQASTAYVGMGALNDATGEYYNSRGGKTVTGGYHNFAVANNQVVPEDRGYVTLVGYYRGISHVGNRQTEERIADTPSLAWPMFVGTTSIQPVMYLNWNTAGNTGRTFVDYFKVEAVQEQVADSLGLGLDLGKFWSKWANRDNAPVTIVVGGDSISEGGSVGTAGIDARWQQRLQQRLRKTDQPDGIAGARVPYIPARFQLTNTAMKYDDVLTSTATPGTSTDFGLGGRHVQVQTGQHVTFTFTGTSAKLAYTKGTGSGIMKVTVDGTVLPLINTLRPEGNLSGELLDIPGLAPGVHTVKVERDASSTSHVYPEGLYVYNGDEAKGIRVIDSAFWGTTAVATQAQKWHESLKAVSDAALFILAYGTNDANAATSRETLSFTMRSLINKYRVYTPNASFLIVNWPKRGSTPESNWDNMVEAMKDVAYADPEVGYIDFRNRTPKYGGASTGDAVNLGYYADNVHPSAIGHSWIADVLKANILPK